MSSKRTLQGKFFYHYLSQTIDNPRLDRVAYLFRKSGPYLSKRLTGQEPLSEDEVRFAANKVAERCHSLKRKTTRAERFKNAYRFIKDDLDLQLDQSKIMPRMARRFLWKKGLLKPNGKPITSTSNNQNSPLLNPECSQESIELSESDAVEETEFADHHSPSFSTAPLSRPTYITEEQAFTDTVHSQAIWLNPHNHHSLPLVGRDKEWTMLEGFINSRENFKIAAVIAPSGAGKTRLISQWSKIYIDGKRCADWDAGFVNSSDAELWSEANWQPSKNTLIIVDYTYIYSDVIAAVIDRFKGGSSKLVRLLVLDHVLPEKLHDDVSWKKGIPDLAFREANGNLFYKEWPIILEPAQNETADLRKVVAAAADPFTSEALGKQYKEDSPEIDRAVQALMTIGAVNEKTATRDEIRRQNSIRHPLFAALMGQIVRENREADFSVLTRRDLLERYFSGARRIPWRDDAPHPRQGYWVGLYISAATLLRGVTRNDVLAFQDDLPLTAPASFTGSEFDDLLDICGRFVSAAGRQEIKPLEPDILGETFFLDF